LKPLKVIKNSDREPYMATGIVEFVIMLAENENKMEVTF
jgi:hypothetical protein